ncbi:MAG: carboxypeptidase regulatory-like domain-containing protein [Bryobacteraceae bacterium]|nr:carboxypeptidase regulatory-like domain-containing protein [Bryobacteraceae bacterium]
MTMRTVYSWCVWAALAALAMMNGAAQTTTASLRGQVTDPSAAAIPEAVVTLTGNGLQRRAQTDLQGQYVFQAVTPGKYTVRVTKTGFAVFEVQEFEISGAVTLDVPMTVTMEAQKVTVNDDRGNVSTDPNSNAGSLILKGKDLEALSDDPDQLASDLQALAGPAAGPNGGQIFIDGFSGGRLPPKSAIREVRINSNPFSAEYDRLGFGRIEIFTKPGTDRFRGQVMGMFSDNVLNARNPFVATRPTFQSRMLVGTVSGPVTKKSSFSFDVERRAIDENAVINATVLDSEFQPSVVREAVGTPQMRWNIVPRFDYQLNEKNTLTVRYNHGRNTGENQGVGNFSLASRAYDSFDRDHTLQVTENMVLSARALMETRFQYMASRSGQDGDNTTPTISVLDAFTGGGAQTGVTRNNQDRYEFHNIVSLTAGTHSWKFGGRLRRVSLDDRSPQNFGGTFTFTGGMAPALDGSGAMVRIDSLERYRRTLVYQAQGLTMAQIRAMGGGASQFSIAGGNPLASVQQTDLGVFVLDDWRLKPNFTLSYGLRYEAQTNISDRTNFSPRVGFAWGVGGGGGRTTKTVVRGGAGIFYDRVGENLTLQALRFDGVTQEQYIVQNPDFYPAIPSLTELSGNQTTQTIRQVADDIRAPYILQTAFGIDRQLPGNTQASVTYTFSRGVHMLRTRNVNAPLADGTYPLGSTGNVFRYESTGTMRQHQVTTNFSTRFSRYASLFGFYGLNFARGDTDGVNTFPADSYNLSSEWGSTMFDVRHRALVGGAVTGPWNLSLSPFVTFDSGMPFNITTGRDNNGDTTFNDRPAFAAAGTPGAIVTAWGIFNTNPGAGDTIIPRNYGRGPRQFNVNLRLSRTWGFGKRGESGPGANWAPPGMGGGGRGPGGPGGGPPPGMGGGGGRGPGGPGGPFGDAATGKRFNLTLGVMARNIFNFVNLSAPVGNLSSPLFGESTSLAGGFGPMGGSASSNRRIDLQLRLSF